LIEFSKIPKHEDCQDKLQSFTFQEIKETNYQLVFISHRWLSNDHPDPNSEQLETIKSAFQNVISLISIFESKK